MGGKEIARAPDGAADGRNNPGRRRDNLGSAEEGHNRDYLKLCFPRRGIAIGGQPFVSTA